MFCCLSTGHNADGMPDIPYQPQARQDEEDAQRMRDGTRQARLGRSGYMHVPLAYLATNMPVP